MGQNNDYHQILIVFKVKKKIYRNLLSLFTQNRRNSTTISIDRWTKETNHCTPAGGKNVQLAKGCQHLWNGLLIKVMNNTRNHPGQQRESSCLVQCSSLSSLITKKNGFYSYEKKIRLHCALYRAESKVGQEHGKDMGSHEEISQNRLQDVSNFCSAQFDGILDLFLLFFFCNCRPLGFCLFVLFFKHWF